MSDLGVVLIIAVVIGVGFAVWMEVDKFKSVKLQNPRASKKQLFSMYVDLTNADAEERRRERRKEAARRNERYLERIKSQMTTAGMKVFSEEDEKIYYMDTNGHTCSFDKKDHYIMEEYM